MRSDFSLNTTELESSIGVVDYHGTVFVLPFCCCFDLFSSCDIAEPGMAPHLFTSRDASPCVCLHTLSYLIGYCFISCNCCPRVAY